MTIINIKSYHSMFKAYKLIGRSIKNILMSIEFQIFILCRCHNFNCCNIIFSISDFSLQNATIPTKQTHLWSKIIKPRSIFIRATCRSSFISFCTKRTLNLFIDHAWQKFTFYFLCAFFLLKRHAIK